MLQNKQVRLPLCLLVCEYAIEECQFTPFYTTCELMYHCKPQRGSDSTVFHSHAKNCPLTLLLEVVCRLVNFSDGPTVTARFPLSLSLSMGVWEQVGRLQKEERDFVWPCVGRKRKKQTAMRQKAGEYGGNTFSLSLFWTVLPQKESRFT